MVDKLIRKSLLPIVFCAISSHAWADVVIVVHPSNSSAIDSQQAQRIFLGKEKKFTDGKEALPINSASGYSSRELFDTTVLKRSSPQVAAYWSKLVFTGKGIPPKEVEDDAAVIAIVANNQNAIGYVDSGAVTGDVKAIQLN